MRLLWVNSLKVIRGHTKIIAFIPVILSAVLSVRKGVIMYPVMFKKLVTRCRLLRCNMWSLVKEIH